jgi:hypothetical protein
MGSILQISAPATEMGLFRAGACRVSKMRKFGARHQLARAGFDRIGGQLISCTTKVIHVQAVP